MVVVLFNTSGCRRTWNEAPHTRKLPGLRRPDARLLTTSPALPNFKRLRSAHTTSWGPVPIGARVRPGSRAHLFHGRAVPWASCSHMRRRLASPTNPSPPRCPGPYYGQLGHPRRRAEPSCRSPGMQAALGRDHAGRPQVCHPPPRLRLGDRLTTRNKPRASTPMPGPGALRWSDQRPPHPWAARRSLMIAEVARSPFAPHTTWSTRGTAAMTACSGLADLLGRGCPKPATGPASQCPDTRSSRSVAAGRKPGPFGGYLPGTPSRPPPGPHPGLRSRLAREKSQPPAERALPCAGRGVHGVS